MTCLIDRVLSEERMKLHTSMLGTFFCIHLRTRVRFKISTFCMIWKDTIFSVISILNFFKSNGSQTFIKTKIILKSNTIVFDPYNLFVFVNVWLIVFFKKFNMDIWVKMVSFQIIQNVLNVKTNLEWRPCPWYVNDSKSIHSMYW